MENHSNICHPHCDYKCIFDDLHSPAPQLQYFVLKDVKKAEKHAHKDGKRKLYQSISKKHFLI